MRQRQPGLNAGNHARALVMLGLALSGCASLHGSFRPSASLDQLAKEARAEGLPLQNPLSVSARTVEQTRDVVGIFTSETERMRRLIRFLVDSGHVSFKYSLNRSLTAEEAYQRREGDCMAYSNLYIALARALGVPAHFVRITSMPSFYENAGVMYRSTHMAVGYQAAWGKLVVDFASDAGDWRTSLYDYTTDEEAFALFYDNVAMDWLLDGRADEAEHLLRFLLQRQPHLRELYSNLGTVLMHQGRAAEALAVLTDAISRFPQVGTLYLNAAQAARGAGNVQLSEQLLARGGKLDHGDAFFLFGRGLSHYQSASYGAAVTDFRRASRSQPTNTVILSWLVRSYLSNGQRSEGLETYQKLVRMAPTRLLLARLQAQFPASPAAQQLTDHGGRP